MARLGELGLGQAWHGRQGGHGALRLVRVWQVKQPVLLFGT